MSANQKSNEAKRALPPTKTMAAVHPRLTELLVALPGVLPPLLSIVSEYAAREAPPVAIGHGLFTLKTAPKCRIVSIRLCCWARSMA
jgi:hypothetical protein